MVQITLTEALAMAEPGDVLRGTNPVCGSDVEARRFHSSWRHGPFTSSRAEFGCDCNWHTFIHGGAVYSIREQADAGGDVALNGYPESLVPGDHHPANAGAPEQAATQQRLDDLAEQVRALQQRVDKQQGGGKTRDKWEHFPEREGDPPGLARQVMELLDKGEYRAAYNVIAVELYGYLRRVDTPMPPCTEQQGGELREGCRSCIFAEIEAERERQDKRWGGLAHDQGHVVKEWVGFICEYAAKAGKLLTWEDCRYRLIQVAALAVAAIESTDKLRRTKAEKWVRPQPPAPAEPKMSESSLTGAQFEGRVQMLPDEHYARVRGAADE